MGKLTLEKVKNFKISEDRKCFSATHEEILEGLTTDIYFVKTQMILEELKKEDSIVAVEIFARKKGVFAGLAEAKNLLENKDIELWSLEEGEEFEEKEVLMQIKGKYSEFGIYETPLLGILASSCGWASAAREIKEAADGALTLVFGARHVHPAVAPVMERSALLGGVDGASCIVGAKIEGQEPKGTVPHAVFLIAGDTVEVAKTYDAIMPSDDNRLVLVDTFKDEGEEAIRVAEALGKKLNGIRLDTPSERGGVSQALVKEMRARLDLAGFSHVQIFVSGGLTPERVQELKSAGADAFGVGSYISGARAIDMTMDIKEVNGQAIAKRGRIPGLRSNPRLKKIK